MAKAQAAARIMTEVAPPQLVSVMRRRKQVARSLDTIAEDDRELMHGGDGKKQAAATCGSASNFATSPLAFERQTPPAPAASGLMRELSKWFSRNDAHGQEEWPERNREGHRRARYAQQVHVHGGAAGFNSR
ncbi:uncharacterized protein LOC102715370 [Oryza brachyantha]|uniref:Uncharacterized protein n=1 Tax=Oryza brachyantha TaxID=4533 RepID=J3L9U3_ORYBR|nr:uncharacterized protein LOC102715370 [Oryza brachyantha]